MQDGGWLNKFEQGGMTLEQKDDNYGIKPNPNDVQASVGPDFVGLGYDTTGRNYSPAWGGQFEDGGYVAQKGKSVPTMADSLALYNNANKVLNYYKGKKYQNLSSGEKYRKKNYYKERNKESLEQFIRRNKMNSVLFSRGTGSEMTSIPIDSYYKRLDDGNRYFQREGASAILDMRAPMQLFDDRITPTMLNFYRNIDKNDPLTDDYVSIFSYDPILVKPVSMLTPEEKATRLKRYGKESGLIDKNVKLSTSTEKSKTEPEKKKTSVVKKSEEIKSTESTPKGSKKYIVNGMEVSEEDFLGSGNTTGGSKRIIYSTPKLGTQKVLRLDGTPETDPEKIRKALNAQKKDDEFQNGGNLWNTNKTAWVDSIHNARKGDLNFVQRMFDQRAGSIQIPGQPGTSTHYMESGDGKAYPTVVQMPNGKLQYLNQNDKDAAWNYANKTGQFIKFPNDEQAEWYANNGYKKGTNVLKKAMGGSLPGAVGFTYARTINPAPSNGKYAKKTKASAKNGKEMKFYQEGLDFKPNSIAQDGAIVDPMGQWAHPGEVTIIPGTDITMEGVDYPVLGISDTGDQQMMYPGEDYNFDGEYVTEYPMMKEGGWLSKFDTAQKGKTIPKPELTSSNIPYTPITSSTNVKAGTKKPTVTLSSQEEILDEQQRKKNENKPVVEKKYENIETVKQDNRTSREKEIAQQELLKLMMQEAQGASPFAQTLSSFTPTGYNPEAGKIAAENIGQMTPMMGATRLFNTVRDPENNPYGIGQGNGFLANTLGTLGLIGDALDVGVVTAPGVKAAGKYLTEQTPLKNTYKLNPFAFKPTEGMMYRGLGVEGMEDAFQSGVFRAKQDVEPSMVGNFDLSKRFDKAYFSPKFDVADQYGQGYIAEVPRTASDWGKRYSKKEWSQIAQRDIPITEGKILQKDWLKGYKEVPQQSPDLGSVFQLNTKGAVTPTLPKPKLSIAPRGNYLESELTKGNKISLNDVDKLGKKEIDWLQSDEYLKRRSAATGESASEIQKDIDEIINRWGNLSVRAANTGKDASGFYSRGKKRILLSDKLNREEALPVLDHEVKHALSQMGGLTGFKGYKKYPTTKVDTWLNRTLGLKNAHYYAEPWEQQVRGLRLLDFIEKTQGIPRGTTLSMEDITQFARNVSPSSPSKEIMELFDKDYNDVIAQLMKMKDADKKLKFIPSNMKKLKSPFQYEQKGELRKNILDWLNRTYAVPVGVGIGAGALGSDEEMPQQKDGGWLTKYK
jgi:hypothetical protein